MALTENFCGFFSNRPPIVVFMICLASFAVSLMTFAYIIKSRELPDPDVSEDWNTMLEKFSKLQFCVPHKDMIINTSSPKLSVNEKNAAEVYQDLHKKVGEQLASDSDTDDQNPSDRQRRNTVYFGRQIDKREGNSPDLQSKMSKQTKKVSYYKSGNVTVGLNFVYLPSSKELKYKDMNSLHLLAQVSAHQLKLDISAKIKGEEKLQVHLNFPSNLSDSTCEEKKEGICIQHLIPVCVTFSGPANLLPHTPTPDQEVCSAYANPSFEERESMAGSLSEATQSDWCQEGSRLLPQYTLDDSLTVFLSMHDKSLINMHLMRTSYFLFVMIVTFFLLCIDKGKTSKSQICSWSYI